MPVVWRVTRSPDMADTVARGETSADATTDYTVKVDVTSLAPDTINYYWFGAMGADSRVGRTRTLPSGHTERLRLEVLSCVSLPHGFFNVYRRVAERADLNVVLHVGDYLYERGNTDGQYGADGRTYKPNHEIVTL